MNVQQNQCSKKASETCPQCAVFYGSEAFGGLCSSCHKKIHAEKKEEIVSKSPAETSTPMSVTEQQVLQSMQQLSLEPVKKEQKDKKRCFDCNKKIGLLGIECKCSYVYCNTHRLPQNHKCQFDHKNIAKQKLRKEVIKVYNGKVTEI